MLKLPTNERPKACNPTCHFAPRQALHHASPAATHKAQKAGIGQADTPLFAIFTFTPQPLVGARGVAFITAAA